MIYISGPGHGGPALVANTYLEGTYTEIYPAVTRDEAGLKTLFRQFSFPGGIPSHVAPETPGSIHEGGELGLFAEPRLRCGVRQPEADRGLRDRRRRSGDRPAGHRLALATSSSTRRPTARCCRSCTSTATRSPTRPSSRGSRATSFDQFLSGCGWEPFFVEGDDPAAMHALMAATMDEVMARIQAIQRGAQA